MNKINSLVEEFPQCFDKHFERDRCGDGWYGIVRDFVRHLASHNTNIRNQSKREWEENLSSLEKAGIPATPWQDIGWIQISCIKEKFGTLRIYLENADEFANGLSIMAESHSNSVCEECGSNQNLVSCRPWVRNLCEPCAAEWQRRQAERQASPVTYQAKENPWDSLIGGLLSSELGLKRKEEELEEYRRWRAKKDEETRELDAAEAWWSSLGHAGRAPLKEKYKMSSMFVGEEVIAAWRSEVTPL
jgi:hypothetical protein